MTGHVSLSPLSAHLAGRALTRSLDGREHDETPAERTHLELLAAALDAAIVVGMTRVVIEIADPVARQADEDHVRESILGAVGVA
ncbi:hypothetical protein [Miltoncostaea oceani]|uniref:hypothetical protein n=1 Tax=Miltoncostaea oceani TaxID=2843216 RepID=UPI001C3C4CE7|nr:hypothetical protein [Miltoncostaea oceani]